MANHSRQPAVSIAILGQHFEGFTELVSRGRLTPEPTGILVNIIQISAVVDHPSGGCTVTMMNGDRHVLQESFDHVLTRLRGLGR